ncbi:MAG: TIGR02678 family protein [Cellulosilyticaceae bacterium]
MTYLKYLLEKQFILREEEPDIYYDIKDHYKDFKKFIVDKLGYELLIRTDFIKLEKLPGHAEAWMGIPQFDEVREYIMLMLIFVFLEDKNKEDQFLLSHITEFIAANGDGEHFDWTVYKNRRSLIKVIGFALNQRLMKITDGEEESFVKDESKEVLFESTGLSKYMPRNFAFDISTMTSPHQFIAAEREIERRYRVYRRLVLSPVVYNTGSDDEDYGYIKQNRNIIQNDLEKYLGWQLHVHRNGALVIPEPKDRPTYAFPGTSAISDMALQYNQMICQKVRCGEIIVGADDTIWMPKALFRQYIESLRETHGSGWSKEYRESSDDKLYFDMVTYMSYYQMIEERIDEVVIYPIVAKVVGDYPRAYREEVMADE